MDVIKMLEELRNEREAIEEAIVTLERLAHGRGRRRGRPPAWLAELKKSEKGKAGPAAAKTKAAAGKTSAAN